jgi:hypothetical protein
MSKYLVLYNSPESARKLMTSSTPEQMKASAEEWIKWRQEAAQTAKVDFGLPLEPVSKITLDAIVVSTTQVTGYSIIEGQSKDGILALLQTHPHLKRPGATLDVLEMLPMPGLEDAD